jgi:hypothetical protein
MLPGKPLFAIAAMGLGWAVPASAEELGARSMGRGGVGRADAADVGGEAENLAALSLVPRYEIVAGAELGPDARFLLRSNAVDSRTSKVTLGAGYQRLTDNVPPTGDALPGWKLPGEELENPTSHQGVHLGLAVPFLDHRLAIAAHTRFDWRSSDLEGDDNAFNFGFSVAGRPLPTLTLAAGARDLLGGYADTTRSADLSVRYDPGPYLGIEADVTTPLEGTFTADRLGVHAGFDVGAVKWLALRGGWYMDEGTHFATAGIGLISEQATLDYGVRVQLDDPARNWHGLDLRVSF